MAMNLFLAYLWGGVLCLETSALTRRDIYLVGSEDACSGRVELYHDGEWGTVCADDDWDMADANVVCRDVGCGEARSAPRGAHFGSGTGPIVLRNVQCTGTELSLRRCPAKEVGESECTHADDAGVVCSGVPTFKPPIKTDKPAEATPVRLTDGPNECTGRVEILFGDHWSTIVDEDWDLDDAKVVCRSLGCGTASSAPLRSFFGRRSGRIGMRGVECKGTESSIDECGRTTSIYYQYMHSRDAGVVCQEFRLVNGSNNCSGRIEVFHNEEWGTVCDADWGIRDAQVLCRELNCGNAVRVSGGARFGQGSGPIWLDKVNCTGQERRVSECPKGPWGVHSCDHSRDASVECSGSADIRLVNGSSHCNGRVEVFRDGLWGTVCDDDWDIQDATVVCQQLGCGVALSALKSAKFGRGTGPIWLDDVGCKGTESDLSACSAKSWGQSNCGHDKDAGVVCSELLRLSGGLTPCSGRVEVLHNKQWGTVCDNGWDLADAHVTCKEVGCGKALAAPGGAKFGQGSGPSWMDQVNCTGQEDSLKECPAAKYLEKSSCDHSADAGVECAELLEIRLSDGPDRCAGRVEIFHEDRWGTVRDNGWDLDDAKVVCWSLGCGTASLATRASSFGEGSGPVWLDEVDCDGTENTLSKCKAKALGNQSFDHSKDAGVVCTEFRLVKGSSPCSGRVEVFHNREWGTVCDADWDIHDAQVVCRELDCGNAIRASGGAHFGQGSGRIWLEKVNCTGHEATLSECPKGPWGVHSCDHSKDASVECSGQGGIRLVNGSSHCNGRVEVFHYGLWGTICSDDWDLRDAKVACRQLGCGDALSAPRSAKFGRGTGPIWLANVGCKGMESALGQCSSRVWGQNYCSHEEDAGAVCSDLRLADGPTPCSGRVEVLHNYQWGTVCDNGWDLADARVACREVDCGKALAAPGGAKFGRGSGPTWLDHVDCTGEEDSLSKCPAAKPWGENSCDHSSDASVECAEGPEIRLSDGPNRCIGRVEILHEDLWGTVCKDGWDVNDAKVVCRSLGCGTAFSVTEGSVFGKGAGPIWLDDVNCNGTENSIGKCRARDWGDHDCGHPYIAGVACTEFRLVNGSNRCSGRIEVFHKEEWGTVCDADWDIRDAQVLCRELGCGNAVRVSGGAQFGQGSGPIWLEKVNCTGQEARVSECPKGPWGLHSCDHSRDASVECSGPAEVRLVDGSSHCNGRVEVYHDGMWGTSCNDFRNIKDATVICRQVGCGIARPQVTPTPPTSANGHVIITLDAIECKGTESALSQCSASSWGETIFCSPWKGADVVCSELKLVGGSSPCSGRVEILHNQQWGTVCDNNWDLADANVVCREVGCGRALAAPGGAKFGQGSGPTWMDQVNCIGEEDSLSNCSTAKPLGENSCDHSQDASVECAGDGD